MGTLNKIFNDPIHGSIELHPYLVSIIDTPEFQRLRYIKQMGSVYFVYPGACHNRFEHSIGVAYLAGELVQALNKQSDVQELKKKRKSGKELITEEEGRCVQIAALCHDLGHGPFSHLTDDLFIPRVIEEIEKKEKEGTEQENKTEQKKKTELKNWTHEKQSQAMLGKIIKSLEVKGKDEDKEASKLIEENLVFIKELIDPPKKPTNPKSFLYEIVSNKRNGIDVDKMDYFARDCYHLGIASNFNFRRFFKFARVCLCNADADADANAMQMQICMRDKEVGNMYELYHTRNNIHWKACQHKVSSAIDTMIVDAFIKADGALKISDSLLDVTKHTKLTDGIYQKILHLDVKEELDAKDEENLRKAQKILQRIESRDLYKCVCEIYFTVKKDNPITLEDKAALAKELGDSEDIGTRIMERTYGMKGVDPIKQVNFYTKSKPNEAKELDRKDVSQLLPNVFFENVLHIYWKNPIPNENKIKALKEKAKQWCDRRAPKNNNQIQCSCLNNQGQ